MKHNLCFYFAIVIAVARRMRLDFRLGLRSNGRRPADLLEAATRLAFIDAAVVRRRSSLPTVRRLL